MNVCNTWVRLPASPLIVLIINHLTTMKKSEIKLWDTFYNSNGVLCLCYNITPKHIHVISYTVSIYTLVNNNMIDYMKYYKHTIINPMEFFKNFPKNKLHNHHEEIIYNSILEAYMYEDMQKLLFTEPKINKKLLLIS